MSAKRASAPKSIDLGAAKKKTKTAKAQKPAPKTKTPARASKPPPAAKAAPKKKPKSTPPEKPKARTVPARVTAVKKTAVKTASPAKKAPRPTPSKPAAAPAAPPAKARTEKDKPMVDTAKPTAPRAVVRIARGMRTPKVPTPPAQDNDTPRTLRRDGPPSARRPVGPKIEVNPRLERSKHLITSGGASAEPAGGVKPMSVAAKHRAAAEAVFARLTVPEQAAPTSGPATPAPSPAPLPFAARPPEQGGGGGYAARINEQDSLVTSLRLSTSPEETLGYARQLAERFKLPPDQSMLLRVIDLGDAKLTKLALEELLELEDRGRVRPSAELKSILGGLKSRDPETLELKQLLLEKIGVSP